MVISAAALLWFLLTLRFTIDYRDTLPGSDNAAPPIAALAHLRIARLAAVQTLMGLTSLLWRAPFVAPVLLSHGDTLEAYVVGATVCVLPVVGLVAWLVAQDRSVRQIPRAALAALLMVLGPASVSAIQFGHPEEILTTVLVVGGVIAAQADRRTAAALLLGLAIGSKEWALLCTPAVLIALPGGRRRAAVVAFGVGALLIAPLPVMNLAAFHRADAAIDTIRSVSAISLWWPIRHLPGGPLPLGLGRSGAAFGSVSLLLACLWLLGRRLRARAAFPEALRVDPMALLALTGLLRCICDPGDFFYYLVAAAIPIAVWEAGTLRRLPVIATLLCGLMSLCFTGTAPFGGTSPALEGATGIDVFLVATAVLMVYLAVRTLAPPRAGAAQPAGELPRHGLAHSA